MDVLTAENFRLVSCQAALFTPDEEVSSIKLTTGFLPRWVELFNADPMVAPATEGLPRDARRLILNSQSRI
jgi:hypothetical protein